MSEVIDNPQLNPDDAAPTQSAAEARDRTLIYEAAYEKHSNYIPLTAKKYTDLSGVDSYLDSLSESIKGHEKGVSTLTEDEEEEKKKHILSPFFREAFREAAHDLSGGLWGIGHTIFPQLTTAIKIAWDTVSDKADIEPDAFTRFEVVEQKDRKGNVKINKKTGKPKLRATGNKIEMTAGDIVSDECIKSCGNKIKGEDLITVRGGLRMALDHVGNELAREIEIENEMRKKSGQSHLNDLRQKVLLASMGDVIGQQIKKELGKRKIGEDGIIRNVEIRNSKGEVETRDINITSGNDMAALVNSIFYHGRGELKTAERAPASDLAKFVNYTINKEGVSKDKLSQSLFVDKKDITIDGKEIKIGGANLDEYLQNQDVEYLNRTLARFYASDMARGPAVLAKDNGVASNKEIDTIKIRSLFFESGLTEDQFAFIVGLTEKQSILIDETGVWVDENDENGTRTPLDQFLKVNNSDSDLNSIRLRMETINDIAAFNAGKETGDKLNGELLAKMANLPKGLGEIDIDTLAIVIRTEKNGPARLEPNLTDDNIRRLKHFVDFIKPQVELSNEIRETFRLAKNPDDAMNKIKEGLKKDFTAEEVKRIAGLIKVENKKDLNITLEIELNPDQLRTVNTIVENALPYKDRSVKHGKELDKKEVKKTEENNLTASKSTPDSREKSKDNSLGAV